MVSNSMYTELVEIMKQELDLVERLKRLDAYQHKADIKAPGEVSGHYHPVRGTDACGMYPHASTATTWLRKCSVTSAGSTVVPS